jgi:uncharacterized protein
MDAEAEGIRVEVAYALPERQRIVALNLPAGSTAFAAARQSGIERMFPGLELETARMGVFGVEVADPRSHVLRDGDRVEIYRELTIDPREARKARARKR